MRCRSYKFILIAILVGTALTCGGNNQQSEANRLVGEANRLLGETNKLIERTEARNQRLFDADVQTIEELAAYKIKMKSEAQEIVENYAKASEMLAEIAGKFEKATKLNVREIFKEYAATKSEEFAKRAEAFNVRKGNAQVFIEFDSPQKMTDKFDENNSRFEKLIKEADELGGTAKRIENENRDFFAEFK
ncbi:MAG TPA: hypothetical protein VNB22_10420 [Pyrinomonadaceae bacterium]|nr:hypothetical protein [Pyrinomonadaceae bacterium]